MTVHRPTTPDLSLVCISDRPDALRQLIACLRLQTCPSWELLVLDQTGRAKCLPPVEAAEALGEKRVHWYPVPRIGDWGQTMKYEYARDVAIGKFLAFPCDDAYYVPHFVERMLWHAREADLGLVYCTFLFDVEFYQPREAKPEIGHCDVGGFIVRRDVLVADGWPDRNDSGDGALVKRLSEATPHGLVPGGRVLYVKN